MTSDLAPQRADMQYQHRTTSAEIDHAWASRQTSCTSLLSQLLTRCNESATPDELNQDWTESASLRPGKVCCGGQIRSRRPYARLELHHQVHEAYMRTNVKPQAHRHCSPPNAISAKASFIVGLVIRKTSFSNRTLITTTRCIDQKHNADMQSQRL